MKPGRENPVDPKVQERFVLRWLGYLLALLGVAIVVIVMFSDPLFRLILPNDGP